ncbi:MAG: putative purine permease YbbY [Syntrophus sp. PtaU1.Bin208]|nr:MAG: putative purine permease YbbY [Syntrophus sp. PtaU1.Bin208]
MQFKYSLNERPPFGEILLYGFQWFAITLPTIIVLGKITGGFHFATYLDQMVYLQKLLFVMAVALLAQLFLGHRMPLIVGPSTILLVGILSGTGHPAKTMYSSILLGGLILSLASATGLLGHLKRLFSPRVVAVVLILIAFTLAPTLVNLIAAGTGSTSPLAHVLFSLVLVIGIFAAHRFLSGVWKSTLIIWAMAAGSLAWYALFPDAFRADQIPSVPPVSGFFQHFTVGLSFDAGVLISFLVCFLALFINDLGSIQSMNELLKPADAGKRINRGVMVTGLSNMLSGFFGVIGPVNYSLSPGVIAATGCASRVAMMPTAALLLLLAFSPAAIGFISGVPSIVVGTILIYILSSQIAAGLMMIFESIEEFRLSDGLIIGLPLMLATIIAFLPAAFLSGLPSVLRPILGNGFVVGITAVLLMEHWIFRN